jgi:CotH kinase protein/Lamin Tail Domain/Chitobiase/beta-hexosaminidase C-terminal domain
MSTLAHLWIMHLETAYLIAALCVSNLAAQDPVISEFMARNASTLRDDRGEMSDWIEIHNPRSTGIDMTGWYLTDDATNLKKFRFDARTIPAGGYLIVHASGLDRRFAGNPLHTNFTLNGDKGEYVALVKTGGTTVASQITFTKQRPDVSFGRDASTNNLVFFDAPTPGKKNGSGFNGLASRVIPSVVRGFYEKALNVTLSSASVGATIRFTTDGSRPTRNLGTVYSRTIAVSKTTTLRMVAYSAALATSRVDTHSYIFPADVLKQNNTPPGYPATWGTHWTGRTNFTANADYAMDPAIVGSSNYGPRMVDSLRSLPSISIVLDIADLFDVKTGIYSNPLKSGEAWERPTSVEILYPRMGRHVQGNAGVRIMGGGSRRPWLTPKHSLRLLFKEGYGPSKFGADLFGLGAALKFDTIALRSVFNDSFTAFTKGGGTYLRDMLVRDAHRAGGRIETRGAFAHVYINGLYWGLYNPSERPDANFQAHYFGGTKNDYDVLKHVNGEVVAGDKVAFDKAIAIASGGLSSAAAYSNIRQYIDVASLADYMALNIWAGTTDWPLNNWYMARRRVAGGTFQFFNWDAEISLNDVNANRVNVRATKSPAFFYDKLRANAEFRVLFGDRAHRLLDDDGPLVPRTAGTLFDKRAAEIRSAIIAETARWGDVRVRPGYTRDKHWTPSVDWIGQTFLPQRRDKVVAQLRSASLYSTVAAPAFNKNGGSIKPGFKLAITAPKGKIYFTLDGTDPRLVGGAVNTKAQTYSSLITLNQATIVQSRVLDSGAWSALHEAQFTIRTLAINEIMAKNTIGIMDAAGEREDWIELINTSKTAVAAGGLYLTDDPLVPRKWMIPVGTTVQPGAALLIWADGQVAQGSMHANFKLAVGGESVFLFDKDGKTRLSGFYFGPQVPDVSLGRLFDGTGPRVTFSEPTPRKTNTGICRRIFSGRARDLHSLSFDVSAPPRISSLVWLLTKGSSPNNLVFILWSRSAGYLTPFHPASELALLVGAPLMPMVRVPADAGGNTVIPIGIANDPKLVGARFYFQAFSFESGTFRGSNALELTICR